MIYVDLLVIEDFFLNYVILYSTSILLSRITKFKKIFLSSAVGTIPLIFLFMDTNKYILNIISLIFALFMSIISFRYHNILYTIKNIVYMYLISIFIAGSIYLININFLPKIDNYLLNAIFLVIISPIITCIYIKSIIKIKINNSNYYLIDIYLKDKPKITINAFLDTGNKLKDPYNSKPIILVSKKVINKWNSKKILVPYNTIDNHGLLECFSPEKIYIHNVGWRSRVLIGLIEEINIEGADCILNQVLLERI